MMARKSPAASNWFTALPVAPRSSARHTGCRVGRHREQHHGFERRHRDRVVRRDGHWRNDQRHSDCITSGVVVNGGDVEVGNGIVDVKSGGTANVTFLSTGTGGLEIEDTQANPTAYTGVVSGFGGVRSREPYAIHRSHRRRTTPPVSPGHLQRQWLQHWRRADSLQRLALTVAEITLVGTYETSNFHISSGISGTVKITDPSIAEQQPGNAPATIAGGTVLEINTPDSGKVTFGGTGGYAAARPTVGLHRRHLRVCGRRCPGSDGHRLRRRYDARLFGQRHRHGRYAERQ